MRWLWLLSVCAAAVPSGYACQGTTKSLPFCDQKLALEARVSDLLGRLTPDEKIGLLGSAANTDICNVNDAGVSRLEIPSMEQLIEATSGVSAACYVDEGNISYCPSIFSSPALGAASFNRTLWRRKGEVISDEIRAMANLRVPRIYPGSQVNVFAFGPDINLLLDPRNGRNGELPSEDPFLTGEYAVMYTRGLQGEDPQYLKVVAMMKHYVGYQSETNRFGYNGNVSAFDLWDSYLVPYAAGFLGGASSGLMCSYSSINGVPSCSSPYLLEQVVREYWKQPDALVMSDCGAIESQVDPKHYAPNISVASALSVKAGCDVCDGKGYVVEHGLSSALRDGFLTVSNLDTALRRNLLKRFRAGLFDQLPGQVYASYGKERISTTANKQAVEEAAAQGFVLLKNNAVLPLDVRKLGGIAVLGPHAVSKAALMGDYYEDAYCPGDNSKGGSSKVVSDCVPSIGSAIADVAAQVSPSTSVYIAEGVTVTGNDTSRIDEAVTLVYLADVVVLCVGYDPSIDKEGDDHPLNTLPGLQPVFASKVLQAATKSGIPVVVLAVNGGAMALDAPVDLRSAAAIVELMYPGFGAPSLARHLFGLDNRWGRLPYTIYPADYINHVAVGDLAISTGVGRSYRYYAGPANFKFGDGLSYSSFSLKCTANTSTVDAKAPFSIAVQCESTNVGTFQQAGDEILLLYHNVSDSVRSVASRNHPVPLRSLVEFERLGPMLPKNSVTKTFILDPLSLALTTETGASALYPGVHYIEVSPRPPAQSTSFQITITGTQRVIIANPPLVPPIV